MVSFDRPSVNPSGYVDTCTPSLLHSIDRAGARARLGLRGELPFRGEDVWTGYEFSWLNGAGKPLVAGLRLRVPCTSPNIVESKSMKLYLNGFAQTRFSGRKDVLHTLAADLNAAFGAPLDVALVDVDRLGGGDQLPGRSLDDLDVAVCDYERNPGLLQRREDAALPSPGTRDPSPPRENSALPSPGTRDPSPPREDSALPAPGTRDPSPRREDAALSAPGTRGLSLPREDAALPSPGTRDLSPRRSPGAERVTEALHTHLFRSLCPITGQPDWASVLVQYTGAPVEPAGLLKYLVSFRRHAAFHEDTVEQVFVDFMQQCRPDELTVYGRFLRRGGLDINPFRSTSDDSAPELRLSRQ